MAIINATGDAVATIKSAFTAAQRHGRIPRTEKFRVVCRCVGTDDNAFELICLSAERQKLPLRAVAFRQLITDTTPLPPVVRPSRRSNKYIYLR